MQRHKHYLILTLPDRSMAIMDTNNLSFCAFRGDPISWKHAVGDRVPADLKAGSNRQTTNINFKVMASFIEKPHLQFGDCFTRCGPQLRYSFRFAKQEFDVKIFDEGLPLQGGIPWRHLLFIRYGVEIPRRHHFPPWVWMGESQLDRSGRRGGVARCLSLFRHQATSADQR